VNLGNRPSMSYRMRAEGADFVSRPTPLYLRTAPALRTSPILRTETLTEHDPDRALREIHPELRKMRMKSRHVAARTLKRCYLGVASIKCTGCTRHKKYVPSAKSAPKTSVYEKSSIILPTATWRNLNSRLTEFSTRRKRVESGTEKERASARDTPARFQLGNTSQRHPSSNTPESTAGN